MAIDDGAAVKQGFRSQLGIAEESAYNSRAAPGRFYEFRNESLAMQRARIESEAVRNRHFQTRWQKGSRGMAGDLVMELANRNFGLWFKHAFGSVSTSQPNSTDDPNTYEHTFTPGDLVDLSLTAQIVRGDQPFDYTGVKVGSLQIACQIDQLALITASLLGAAEDLSQSAEAASYPDLSLMSFVEGFLTVGGADVPITSANATLDNGLAEDRRRFGTGIRRNPQRTAFRNLSGQFEADFQDLTLYNRFVSGEEAQLVLEFEGGIIDTNYTYLTRLTSNIRSDGETPTVGGLEEIRQPIQFKGIPTSADGDAGAATLLYRTDDSSP